MADRYVGQLDVVLDGRNVETVYASLRSSTSLVGKTMWTGVLHPVEGKQFGSWFVSYSSNRGITVRLPNGRTGFCTIARRQTTSPHQAEVEGNGPPPF
jgi:hypothetical protein